VQIHGGKDNLIDGNVFTDCYAGASFSRWGEKRWLEGVQRFLAEAASQPYASRYPDLSRLRTEPDISFFSRNVFAGCKSVFIRDGGIQRAILSASTATPLAPDILKTAKEAPLRQILLDPIPVDEIGTYDHPWRAKSAAPPR
jgi:hypothetical protein